MTASSGRKRVSQHQSDPLLLTVGLTGCCCCCISTSNHWERDTHYLLHFAHGSSPASEERPSCKSPFLLITPNEFRVISMSCGHRRCCFQHPSQSLISLCFTQHKAEQIAGSCRRPRRCQRPRFILSDCSCRQELLTHRSESVGTMPPLGL